MEENRRQTEFPSSDDELCYNFYRLLCILIVFLVASLEIGFDCVVESDREIV